MVQCLTTVDEADFLRNSRNRNSENKYRYKKAVSRWLDRILIPSKSLLLPHVWLLRKGVSCLKSTIWARLFLNVLKAPMPFIKGTIIGEKGQDHPWCPKEKRNQCGCCLGIIEKRNIGGKTHFNCLIHGTNCNLLILMS